MTPLLQLLRGWEPVVVVRSWRWHDEVMPQHEDEKHKDDGAQYDQGDAAGGLQLG